MATPEFKPGLFPQKSMLEGMTGQQKIEYIRGKVEGYDLRVQKTLDTIVEKHAGDLSGLSAENKKLFDESMREAFLTQVETYMTQNDPGGIGLAPLVEDNAVGPVRISQEMHDELNEVSAALAAQFAVEAGEEKYAEVIKEMVGNLVIQRVSRIAPRPKR